MSIFDRLRALLGGGESQRGNQSRGPWGERDRNAPDAPVGPDTANVVPDGDPPRTNAEQAMVTIVNEGIAALERSYGTPKIGQSARYKALKKDTEEFQIAVLEAALSPGAAGGRFQRNTWQVSEGKRTLASLILRRKIDFPHKLLKRILKAWVGRTTVSLQYSQVPGLAALGALERQAAKDPTILDEFDSVLERIVIALDGGNHYRNHPSKLEQDVLDRVNLLLNPELAPQGRPLPSGPFGDALAQEFDQLDEKSARAWRDLASYAAGAGDKSTPSKKWLKEAAEPFKAVGKEYFADRLRQWMDATTPDPNYPDHSLDILKGFLWMAPLADKQELAGSIGRLAERSYRKVRGVGARSVKTGNAALYALSEMGDDMAAGAELFRLRGVIKYPSARKILEKRIETLADKSGADIAILEDASLPDFGIGEDGTLTREFGEARAVVTLTALDTKTAWINAAGKQVKTIPAPVRKEFKEKLTAFKQLAKDIEKARAGQVRRLEDSWLEARSWAYPDWVRYFLNHSLRAPVVRALVWMIEDSGKSHTVLPSVDGLSTLDGASFSPSDEARVTLWHPLSAEPDNVLAWRARIVELGITQPIKQAHREVYVLTDAEIRTEIYSNRFAAHILRQHQFRALCHAREWAYDFMGGWDSWNVPTRIIPAHNLGVEYSVEPVHDGQHSEAYVPLFIATDQVRFVSTQDGEVVPLVDIDPIVFSEALRDVDLFVGVTSVANDPGWTDGGPNGRFGQYWREWAFGDLGQSAETRKALIAEIAPKLSIREKLEIGEKSLIITGNLHKYAIHFGSANIQIMPANRYLCIVPDRDPSEAKAIRLPFAGDAQLSTILAKAFMLVDESKIKDPTILSQL
ncbi:MAG: DUF4132 domain-containing protein [Pseudomonadota bacterium]